MRRLLPTGDSDADLASACWVDDPGGQLVTAVMISSVDGAAALAGRSGKLGNAADRRLFATLRAQADCILVGAGTARAEGYGGDRPTAAFRELRRARGLADYPRIAVLSRTADLDPASPLFTDTAVRPFVITTNAAAPDNIARLADCADVLVAGEHVADLAVALDALRDVGMIRVSCEGGPQVLAQVVAAGRLAELFLTVSPVLVAGSAPRILTGPVLPEPQRLTLLSALADDGFLYLRYRCGP